jgi:predicted GNAT superfamily acetyltransferase
MHSDPRHQRAEHPVLIRTCSTPDEFKACVEVETKVWNFDPLDAVSHHIMAVANEAGGQVFGAFDGDAMIGFALAFPAIRDGHVHLHSHMAAVDPEYQGRGIGRLLKLAQRDDALARGIEVIEWTFDPLQARNANFNINRLGAFVRRYLPNFYGTSSSPLHANLPTDRIVAEWRLRSARVAAHIAGKSTSPAGNALRIAVPNKLNEMRREKPSSALGIQRRIREELVAAFADGHVITGFSNDEREGFYILEKHYAD